MAERHALSRQAHRDQPQLAVRHLCRLIGVGRTWYSTSPPAAERTARAVDLRDASERLVLACPGSGYRRVPHAVLRAGWMVNHQRVLRVMRQASLRCHRTQRCVVTTDAQQRARTYPTMLRGLVLERPDQAGVAASTSSRLPTTVG